MKMPERKTGSVPEKAQTERFAAARPGIGAGP